MAAHDWPKAPVFWIEGRTLFVSIPFTWELLGVRQRVSQGSLFYDKVIVGGPAVQLVPGYFADLPHVCEGQDSPGVLQRVNPMATRTTLGCIRRCKFCGIGQGKIEAGGFRELADWPDKPILADNNLLAASQPHFDRVVERLKRWGWADFTQGLDPRLLTGYHAERIAEIGRPVVRLALDHMASADAWEEAYRTLRKAKVPLKCIRSYAIVGFDSGPEEAWKRCQWIERHGVKALPMWFHPLDATVRNSITRQQVELGWDDSARKNLMQWFYQHNKRYGGPPELSTQEACA